MRPFNSGALAVVALLLAGSALSAQDALPEDSLGWRRQIVGQLNLSQVSFDNWAQGGENSLAWQVVGAGRFRYQQPRYRWDNSFDLNFGKTKLGGANYRKSVDDIAVASVLAYRSGTLLEPYASVALQTQFARGYRYENDVAVPISDFMDPGYLTQSVGLAWKPSESFTTRLGGALKETFTSDFPAYADDAATTNIETTRVESGLNSVTELNKEVAHNLLLASKLELFSNLDAFNQIDVNWISSVTAKVSSYVNVNFNVRVLYDRDISVARQLNQSLALGVGYTLLLD